MKKVLFLTGAGISAESGIRTFRDGSGLWHEHDIMEVCSDIGFMTDRTKVLNFYDDRRADLADKIPNAAHQMIADLQREFPQNIINITQNVDDLFEKAGCKKTIHLHGELTKIQCESCGYIKSIGYDAIGDHSICPFCKKEEMRHFVVMFGEQAPEYETLAQMLEETKLLVVIGTSGEVLPVDDFAGEVPYAILNNLEPSAAIEEECFSLVIHKKATEACHEIAQTVRSFLQTEQTKVEQ